MEEFPRQKKSKRIHFHQTSTARYAKGTALRRRNRERERDEYKGKMSMNKYLSIITLNVNGLNAPIKGHRVAEWIRNHDLYICCLQETHLRMKDPHRLKVKVGKIYSKQIDREKSRGTNTFIRQNRIQNKGRKKSQRRSLHNT